MYHYVRNYNNSYPNFRFLHIENFIRQLSFFDREYGFVDKNEWFEFVKNGKIHTKR